MDGTQPLPPARMLQHWYVCTMTNDFPPLTLVLLLLRVCDASWHAQRVGSGLREVHGAIRHRAVCSC